MLLPLISDIPYHEHRLKPIPETYIYHKNEKGKPSETDLPLLINDITPIFVINITKPFITASINIRASKLRWYHFSIEAIPF